MPASYGRRAFSAAALSAALTGVPTPLPAATLVPPLTLPLEQRLATPRAGRLQLLKPDPTSSRPDTLHCSPSKTPWLAAARASTYSPPERLTCSLRATI